MNTRKTLDKTSQIETQLKNGWRWLRFSPELEAAFRTDYEKQQLLSRLILIITGLVLISTIPIFDALLMHPPEGFARITHAVQLGIMAPVTLLALIITAIPSLRQYSQGIGIVTVLVIAGGVIFQRHVGAQYNYAVPADLATLIILGSFVLGGVRFWLTLPVALVILAAIACNELLTFGQNSATRYVIHVSLMHVLVASTAGYLQEYRIREGWLRANLLEEMATRDSLTGLLNVRAFHQRYRQMCAQAAREHRQVLIAMMDMDGFKAYNDKYGHLAGDECLIRVAKALSQRMRRNSDIRGRAGGDEFIIACYNITQNESRQLLEELRINIEQLMIPHANSSSALRTVTVSIGGYCFMPANEDAAVDALAMADQQLYAAKHKGRNCIALHGDDGSAAPAFMP